jgi:hypothetical protein
VSVGVWRVNQFPKLVEQTVFDARYLLGRMDRTEYLSRYSDDRKYSAVAAAELADAVRASTQPADRIYLFGFTCSVYADSARASASRFFWSRPVIVNFNAGTPGYGVDGLLADLRRRPPSLVALQRRDWAPDVADSADFFMGTPALADWLQSNYVQAAGPDAFDVWVRRTGPSLSKPGGFAPPDPPPPPQRANHARRGPRSPSLAGTPKPRSAPARLARYHETQH